MIGKRRNHPARLGIMRKGGAHRTPRSGERRPARDAVREDAERCLRERRKR